MIIGKNKELVIENIKKNVMEGKFNEKVEVDDPDLTLEEQQKIIKRFLRVRRRISYLWKNIISRGIVDNAARIINKRTEYEGLEKIKDIEGGAVVTSNHFNPIENTAVKMAVKKTGRGRLYIVSQTTNLAMKGWIGFLMKYTDIIPLCGKDKTYMSHEFMGMLKSKLTKKQWILIYPEQEMWFNYRKPRPPKRGAYYYAAQCNVPVISFFIEIKELTEKENDEFYQVKYIVHVLDPIYPDPDLPARENSRLMMQQDYKQKVEAYEKAYGKKLTYEFSYDDIAGYIPKQKLGK